MTKPIVFLTGGSGFIGSAVLAEFADLNCDIHLFSRTEPQFRSRHFHHHQGDLMNSDDVTRIMDEIKPTHLMHLAWNVAPQSFWSSPLNQIWKDTSLALLKNFARSGGKVVMMLGSCAEYDWERINDRVVDENFAIKPHTEYGKAKHALSEEARAISENFGLQFQWCRLFWLFGRFEKRERLVPDIASHLIRGEKFVVQSPKRRRDYLDTKCLASYLRVLLFSSFSGHINIGSGHGIDLEGIARTLAKIAGREDLIVCDQPSMASNEPETIVADIGLLRSFVPEAIPFDIAESLRDVYEWWRIRSQVSS